MAFQPATYRNSTEIAQLGGVPLYLHNLVDAALRARLNIFLQGDTGSGKTQLMRDVMGYFGDNSLFILGRNDMDTRELFQQVNPEFFLAMKEGSKDPVKLRDLTDRIKTNFIGVDELPNCVPAVRAQLFNLFDGFIEIDGKPYSLGSGYCVGMATGNIGQQFTESSNDLGRALKDRMHLILDVDYFRPLPQDTDVMLMRDRNPRVGFQDRAQNRVEELRKEYESLSSKEPSIEKRIIAAYLMHGLDHLPAEQGGSKIALGHRWPNALDGHAVGSDESLILPISPRAAKAIIGLSQALDAIVEEAGSKDPGAMDSMMIAYKFISAYSGVLNTAAVDNDHKGSKYAAIDAIIDGIRGEFDPKMELIAAGIGMVEDKKSDKMILDQFNGKWSFMKQLLQSGRFGQ